MSNHHFHSRQPEVEVRLNFNESPYNQPTNLIESIVESVRAVNWNRYPDRQATRLHRRIVTLHHSSLEQVFVANGSSEILQCLLLGYAAAGGRVALFKPTFALYRHLSSVIGTEVVASELREDFHLDTAEAVDLISEHRPALTFLCSPNNTTGLVEPCETIAAVLEAVQATGSLLCIDETYGQFAPNSALNLIADDPDLPLVVIRTFSKAA